MTTRIDIITGMHNSYVDGLEEGREEGMTKGREEGMAKGREEGMAEGLAEGARKKAEETARALLKLGMPSETIAQVTGLPPADVEALRTSN